VFVGCIAGTASPRSPGHASARPARSSLKVANCPATPVTGPAHTLTFPPPASVAGWQYETDLGLLHGTEESQLSDGTPCLIPVQQVNFSNSQGVGFTFVAGYHADLWTTFSSFWVVVFIDESVQMYPPGPLGGQVGCGTDSMGSICAWLDSDTIGEVVADASLSQSQVAAALVAMRGAVEQPG
jgi:hypothetical protein